MVVMEHFRRSVGKFNFTTPIIIALFCVENVGNEKLSHDSVILWVHVVYLFANLMNLSLNLWTHAYEFHTNLIVDSPIYYIDFDKR
jgi:hypothetical protein